MSGISIRPQDLAGRPKKIGSLDGKPVFSISTIGGWSMVAVEKSGGHEIIGTGPHLAISRHIAKKRCPDLKLDGLSKSEEVPVAYFSDLVPQYEACTTRMRQLQGLE